MTERLFRFMLKDVKLLSPMQLAELILVAKAELEKHDVNQVPILAETV